VKPKRKRLFFVIAGMAVLGIAVTLAIEGLGDNIVYFTSPTNVYAKTIASDKNFRLGGLVEEDSVIKTNDGLTTTFRVTDLANTVAVSYTGILPPLFREGQGVVTEGHLGADGVFIAESVLAKHDENYLPPEVAEALKKSGQWKGNAQ
jgi:cytochrome c-type biogenesis protein CcmE